MKDSNALENILWRFMEKCGAQVFSFVVSVVLARLLTPEDYGTIALVSIFITLSNVFIDSGLGNSLIQKKNADDIDFSSVFFFNIFVCLVLYITMFFLAPVIGEFYHREELIPILRVLSITLIVSGIKNVQQAYVAKNMLFKKFFFSSLGGTIGAAIVGIVMAYSGYGVWSLVAQQLFDVIVDTIILWITVKWRPKKCFSLTRLKSLLSYGWKFLVSELINTGYVNLRSLIIGKVYSSEDLAFFDKGKHYPNLVITNVNASIDSVLLPTMSAVQDDKEQVREITRRSIKTSIFLIAPLMLGLIAVSEKAITLILTEKWLECVPYLCVFCITYMVYPIHTANLNAIKAMGRSDLFLKLEIAKKIVGLILVFLTMRISVWAMCLSQLVSSVASQLINSYPNRKLLNYRYIDQLKDIFPTLLLASFMGLVVYAFGLIDMPIALSLLIQIVLGAMIYILGAKLFKIDSYDYIIEKVKEIFKNKFHKAD